MYKWQPIKAIHVKGKITRLTSFYTLMHKSIAAVPIPPGTTAGHFGRPARFQTSNFIGPYNLHRLLLSGLGLLFRSLPIVLLDQS